MWNSSSHSSDLAKGKKFLQLLQYVQHVDKEKKMTSEIPERILQHLLANRKVSHDPNLTENVGNPDESNLDILKSSLKDRITGVRVYSNPLPIPIGSSKRVTFHAFVVFTTRNTINSKKEMHWSLEKNGKCIVLQQSTNGDDVLYKSYDAEKGQSVERYGRVKQKKWAMGYARPLEDLLRVIWETNQIIDPYNLLYSNCQNFASFIFENLNGERKKWSTYLSATVDRFRGKKKKPAIELNAVMYTSIVNDYKFDCYRAMMDGRRKDFEELINNLPDESRIEFLNSVDSQGYTLLEWATVFSTSHWPIDEELKKKGAQIPSDLGLFRRNLFFIALQYLPPNKKSKFLSFDEIDITGVNGTGDTALHLALNGEKWEISEDILRKLENYHVNLINSLGDTPLHLAAKLKCEIDLFTKILNRTNSENVNKTDGNGCTALHNAIDQNSGTKVEELLKNKDVDVNITNNEDNRTPLHLASSWKDIPMDLFKLILENSTDINAKDVHGNTALHYAIMTKFETAVKELSKHMDVNVSNNQKVLPLHCACICENIPMDLFKLILEKSTDINARDNYGDTALHIAILTNSENKVKELLKHEKVDVNVKDKKNQTALHLASNYWKDIPSDLFKIILDKSADINAKDKDGKTALHFALHRKSKTKVEKLLAHEAVDVNIKTNENVTALHLAARWWDIPMDLFKLILKRSTNINAQDEDGETALHYASFHPVSYDQEVIEVLVKDDRVDINVKNNDNRTALYYALKWNMILIVWLQMFQTNSTDINAIAEDGETVLRLNILGKIITIDVTKLITPSKSMWFKTRRIGKIVIFSLNLLVIIIPFFAGLLLLGYIILIELKTLNS